MHAAAFDFQQDYFALFGLPPCFVLDKPLLEQHYRNLQAQVHPDKFAHLPESERRLSMQWATRVNEAYQTLRSPLNRARYLLRLHGVDTQEETNTSMPADFLIEQMEWREAIAEARETGNAGELDSLERRLQQEVRALEQRLADNLDRTKQFEIAAGDVRKLRFLEKLAEEIASAFDAIDS